LSVSAQQIRRTPRHRIEHGADLCQLSVKNWTRASSPITRKRHNTEVRENIGKIASLAAKTNTEQQGRRISVAILWSADWRPCCCCISLGSQEDSIFPIFPEPRCYGACGLSAAALVQLLYAELTQVSSMRHAVDEVYDEFVAAETEQIGSRCDKHRACHTRASFSLGYRDHLMRR